MLNGTKAALCESAIICYHSWGYSGRPNLASRLYLHSRFTRHLATGSVVPVSRGVPRAVRENKDEYWSCSVFPRNDDHNKIFGEPDNTTLVWSITVFPSPSTCPGARLSRDTQSTCSWVVCQHLQAFSCGDCPRQSMKNRQKYYFSRSHECHSPMLFWP